MSKKHSKATNHKLIGRTLCLDFANTLNGHEGAPMHEYLTSYRDLALWSWHAGIVTDRETHALLREAERQPKQAASVFARAIALREAIYRIFEAIAHVSSPKRGDLAVLNDARSEALAHSQIVHTADGFAWGWKDQAALQRMLWPITLSAVGLVTSAKVSRIRQCQGDRCDWLFVDTSRNHLRRWCSMSECGNREKSRRFLERRRGRSNRLPPDHRPGRAKADTRRS